MQVKQKGSTMIFYRCDLCNQEIGKDKQMTLTLRNGVGQMVESVIWDICTACRSKLVETLGSGTGVFNVKA